MDEIKNSKTRVCFVSFRAYPIFNANVKGIFGGAEVDLYLLATELARDSNFEVSFVVGDYGQPAVEQREGVTLIRSLRVDRNLMLQGRKIWSALAQANADVYMHEACSLATTLIAAFCKINKRKFVYRTAHSHETDGTYFRQNRLRSSFVKWAFGHADALLTQNQEDADNLTKTLGLTSSVIKNGVRLSAINEGEKETVLWVARSYPIKRPELFLRLAEELPNVAFVMVCPHGAGLTDYQQLKNSAAKIGNLKFVEYVPYCQVDEYFERARVFVNTSDAEGFPNTFVQAGKAGAAILSLNVNPDDFLNKHRCGFCANGNWETMTKTLQGWLKTNEDRLLGQNGRDYMSREHDIAKITEQYKAVFLRIIGRT